MGIKFNPGLEAAGIDPKLVDKLIEVQKMPVEAAKKRRDNVKVEKAEVEKLNTTLNNLDATLNGLKTRYNFYKLKLDSSNPDIIDGTVSPGAQRGTYEFEVRGLARADKQLAYGFPDRNKTNVGFGYMTIERDDGEEVEVVVEPGATLDKLANQINDAKSGVRAMVINTGYQPDSYRLLVTSEKSGKEAKIHIDEDTTYMEFKQQVAGRNLDVLFEDVPVTSNENTLKELIDGVALTVRRSEPGTRVQVSIIDDVEATLKGIKDFVEKYNEVAKFINSQFVKDSKTGEYGLLSGDSTIKSVLRQLQSTIGGLPIGGRKYNTIADIGITTNPKSGELLLDETKVRQSLTDDYDAVAALFIRNGDSAGLAESMAERLKNLRDPGFGMVKSKLRGLQQVIDNQDQDIERRERQLDQSEQNIRHRFTALEGTLSGLRGQSDFLKARMAADKG